MSKVTMPEPALTSCNYGGADHYYTAEQMEAYAAAKVQEALAQHPTSAPDSDAEREAFEGWFQSQHELPRSPGKWSSGGYITPTAQAAWLAWQARAAIAAKETP